MRRTLWIVLAHVATAALSVGLTLFIFLHFYYQPVVVIDMDEIAGYVQKNGVKMETDKAVEYVGKYYDWMAKDLKARKELIIVKKAIYNADKVKDITNDYKR